MNQRQQTNTKKQHPHLKPMSISALLISVVLSSAVEAGSCKIFYQYKQNGQARSATRTISEGQTQTINQSHIDYVKNISSNRVKLFNRNLASNRDYTYELTNGAQDPAVGVHLLPVKLLRVSCQSNSSAMNPADVIRHMSAAGANIGDIVRHLVQVLNLNVETIAPLIKQARISAIDFASALRSELHMQIGQVATVVNRTWRTGTSELANILLQARYSVGDVLATLKRLKRASAKDCVQILLRTTFSNIQTMVGALREAGFSMLEATTGLKQNNINVTDIVSALRTRWGATKDSCTRVLKSANFDLRDIAAAVKQAFRLNHTQLRSTLLNAGYTAQQVNSVLGSAVKKGFGG